jgi:hypothetical protein
MSRRRHTPEQIITALREAEVGLATGKTVGVVSRELGISEQTYYRWRVDQALPRPRSIHSSEDLEGRSKKRGKPQQPQEPMAQPAR